ncbi:hypothetical protein [Streptomyces sp. NRRL S-350]|uniref:hypothetical protein n=1 Tax=Streptomyces sp. NRRL S-350 TaxID=1463902 RepID=UPI0004BEF052|nr:hypothetical protein [Streptomyces sp. NRRL S-350]
MMLPATPVTRRIIALAEEAGLNPEERPAFGNSYRVVVDAKDGMDSPIGHIEIGRRSGRVLRATVMIGLGGPEPQRMTLDGAVAVRAWLQGLLRSKARTHATGRHGDASARTVTRQ